MKQHQAKLYVRAARGRNGLKIDASPRRSNQPLVEQRNYRDHALDTIEFAIEIAIPEEAFEKTDRPVARIEIDPDAVDVVVSQMI